MGMLFEKERKSGKERNFMPEELLVTYASGELVHQKTGEHLDIPKRH
jgi:hypothetical protein